MRKIDKIDKPTIVATVANFTIFTTSLGPRWFGTTRDEIRRQIELGSRVLARGSAGVKRPNRIRRLGRLRPAD